MQLSNRLGQQVLNPSILRRSLRNRLTPGDTDNPNRFVSAHSGSHQRSGCDESRTPDALAAMDGDSLALLKFADNLLPHANCTLGGSRHSAIGNRKGHEADSVRPSRLAFVCRVDGWRLPAFHSRVPVSRTGPGSWLSLHNLARKTVNLHPTLDEHMKTVMTVKYRSVRANFPRTRSGSGPASVTSLSRTRSAEPS
jgi:hypothetical protein